MVSQQPLKSNIFSTKPLKTHMFFIVFLFFAQDKQVFKVFPSIYSFKVYFMFFLNYKSFYLSLIHTNRPIILTGRIFTNN